MHANMKSVEMEKMKIRFSTLWIFAMFNYLYADVLGLMHAKNLEAFLSGYVGDMQLTDEFMLVGAILMETAIVMVLFSRILPYRANRWANIFSGALHTLAVAGSMSVGDEVEPYYMFMATIEIICTLYIVWAAWNWRNTDAETAS